MLCKMEGDDFSVDLQICSLHADHSVYASAGKQLEIPATVQHVTKNSSVNSADKIIG